MTRATRVQTRRRSSKDGQGTSPPWGTLSCLTRVVDLLHVKEPQAPRGPLSKIYRPFPVQKKWVGTLRWADHSFIGMNRSGNWKEARAHKGSRATQEEEEEEEEEEVAKWNYWPGTLHQVETADYPDTLVSIYQIRLRPVTFNQAETSGSLRRWYLSPNQGNFQWREQFPLTRWYLCTKWMRSPVILSPWLWSVGRRGGMLKFWQH
jgi:hypothetical protein